jgi:hypothetical protein
MDLFEKYNLSPIDLGITDWAVVEEKLKKDKFAQLLFVAHAKATVASRESFEAWRTWKGGRTKREFMKEETKRKYKYLDDERNREESSMAFQIALMTKEEYLEFKRIQEEKEYEWDGYDSYTEYE